jgi:hypothetical protein
MRGMDERTGKSQYVKIALLTLGVLIALPFLVLFAGLAEQRWLGTHEISSFAGRIGVKDALNQLYWLLFGYPPDSPAGDHR